MEEATTEGRERREAAVVNNRGGERPQRRRPWPCHQGRQSGQKWRKKEREVVNEELVSWRERERTLVVGDYIGDENGKKKGEAGEVGGAGGENREGRERGRRHRRRRKMREIEGSGGRNRKRRKEKEAMAGCGPSHGGGAKDGEGGRGEMRMVEEPEPERWRSKSEKRGGDAQMKKPWKMREREELVGWKMEDIRILGRWRH